MKLNDKTYDILKWMAMLFLPAASALWIKVADIWGLPFGPEIGSTLNAVNAFMGAVLGISTIQYNKGVKFE